MPPEEPRAPFADPVLEQVKELAAICVIGVVVFWKAHEHGPQQPVLALLRTVPAAVAAHVSTTQPPQAASSRGAPQPQAVTIAENAEASTPAATPLPMPRRASPSLPQPTRPVPHDFHPRRPPTAYFEAVSAASRPLAFTSDYARGPAIATTERGKSLLGDGIHRFWNRQYSVAIQRFQAAHQLNAADAMPLYFLALAQRRHGILQEAGRTLAAAVRTESAYPAPEYGRMLERIQGPERYWLEAARQGISATSL